MAFLTESTTYETGVYQLETTDKVQGGANGTSNVQAKQLANRTKYLKSRIDLLEAGLKVSGSKLGVGAGMGTPSEQLSVLGEAALTLGTTAISRKTLVKAPALQIAGGSNSELAPASLALVTPGVGVQTQRGSELYLVSSRATPAQMEAGTRVAVLSGDQLGTLYFGGDDGTDLRSFGATIGAVATGTWSGVSNPAALVFSVSASGATAVTERMRILPSGYVGIGLSSPQALLDIGGSSGYADQFRVSRSQDMFLAVAYNSTTLSPYVTSYSPPSAANILNFNATTDQANSPPTAGAVGFSWQMLGVEVAKLVGAGQLLVGQSSWTGDAKIQTSNGIRIGAALSSDPNTLDYYEEGAFSPTVAGATSAGSGTYATQYGRYTRVGNRVMFSLVVQLAAHNGTGGIRINGLPFTSSSNGRQPAAVLADSLTFSGSLVAYVNTGSSQVVIASMSGGAALADVAIDGACSLWVCGTYEV